MPRQCHKIKNCPPARTADNSKAPASLILPQREMDAIGEGCFEGHVENAGIMQLIAYDWMSL